MSPLNCPSSKNTIEIMITEYFIEIPNTNIKEPVEGFAYDRGYDQRPRIDTQTFDNLFDAICNAKETYLK